MKVHCRSNASEKQAEDTSQVGSSDPSASSILPHLPPKNSSVGAKVWPLEKVLSPDGYWVPIIVKDRLTVGASCKETRRHQPWSAAWESPCYREGDSRWWPASQPPGWQSGMRQWCTRAGPKRSRHRTAPLPGGSGFLWHFGGLPYSCEVRGQYLWVKALIRQGRALRLGGPGKVNSIQHVCLAQH